MALCAICDEASATLHICGACRRDPANVDWRSAPAREEQGAEQDAGSDERLRVGACLQDVQARQRIPTELQRRVMDLLVIGVLEVYRYQDRRRRFRGHRKRRRALRVCEVARIAACHPNYVLRLRKKILVHGRFEELQERP